MSDMIKKESIPVIENDCELCKLNKNDKKWLLFENTEWIVFLSDKQDYIGRLFVLSKEHIQSLCDLTINQWISLKNIINSCELMLKVELNATMFNWTCLMNDAYKSDNPQPHLHFHIRPRYSNPVSILEKQYSDSEFGHHYLNHKSSLLSSSEIDALFLFLKKKVSYYF